MGRKSKAQKEAEAKAKAKAADKKAKEVTSKAKAEVEKIEELEKKVEAVEVEEQKEETFIVPRDAVFFEVVKNALLSRCALKAGEVIMVTKGTKEEETVLKRSEGELILFKKAKYKTGMAVRNLTV